MIFKSYKLLKKLNTKSEIVIVDDGCPQRSGYYAKEISKKIKNVNIIFHKKNLGYGAAIKTGLKIVDISGFSRQMAMPSMMLMTF